MDLRQQLAGALAGEVASDEQNRTKYSRDASLFRLTPQAITFPKNTQDIQKLVEFVNESPDKQLSLTARSGGTCMSGGSINTSVIIDVSRHLTGVKEVTQDQATVLPGTPYEAFEAATLKHNLLMPSYPASRSLCTVGGMVANNAGGEKTLSYGKTEQYVKQLKVVLRDGNEYTLHALTPAELQQKMAEQTLEGDMHRRLYELLESNYDLIQQHRPTVSKDSTGYHLWNVWNKKEFDLTKLFVGSQGTLGIITEITFRLIKPKPYKSLLVIFLRDLDNLAEIIQTTLRFQPESFESYDDHTLALAIRLMPQMAKKLGAKSLLSLGLSFLPELKMTLTGGLPHLVMLAEFTGHDPQEVKQRAQAAAKALQPLHLNTRIAKNEQEAEKYWTIRRESFSLLRQNVKDKHTAPFIDDLIVRPERLPEFLPRLNEILEQYDIIYTIAGHIGDGNFHIIPLMNLADPKQRRIISELAPKVYDLVFEFEGSMSGEHNDGLIRGPYLGQMYGPEMVQLFKEVKSIFDPNNIFNPHKKTDATLEFAEANMINE